MSSAVGHALILRRMALEAVEDARAWWRAARASPDEVPLLAAYCRCVYASRVLRRAALVLPNSAPQMLDRARRVDAASADLLFRLVRVEGATGPSAHANNLRREGGDHGGSRQPEGAVTSD